MSKASAAQIRWVKANPEKVKETMRRWKQNHPGHKRLERKRYKVKHREKYLAHAALYRAISRKKMFKPDTCPCGNPNPQGHHPDYSKPLMVMWLCEKCHRELHLKEKANLYLQA